MTTSQTIRALLKKKDKIIEELTAISGKAGFFGEKKKMLRKLNRTKVRIERKLKCV